MSFRMYRYHNVLIIFEELEFPQKRSKCITWSSGPFGHDAWLLKHEVLCKFASLESPSWLEAKRSRIYVLPVEWCRVNPHHVKCVFTSWSPTAMLTIKFESPWPSMSAPHMFDVSGSKHWCSLFDTSYTNTEGCFIPQQNFFPNDHTSDLQSITAALTLANSTPDTF